MPEPGDERLTNGYHADWPIWTIDPAADAVVDAAVDDTLGARLRAWANIFDEHFFPRPWEVELDHWETRRTWITDRRCD